MIILIAIILQGGVLKLNAPTKVWLFKRITALFIHYTDTELCSVYVQKQLKSREFLN